MKNGDTVTMIDLQRGTTRRVIILELTDDEPKAIVAAESNPNVTYSVGKSFLRPLPDGKR